jgi:AcrR family transcriptional regulator
MESLLMAQFDPLLWHTVDETLGVALRLWLEPDVLSGSLAARRSYAISLTLGLMLNSHRPAVERFAFGGELHRITQALSHPTEPGPLPAHDASYMDKPIPFATGDPTRDVLLSAVLDEVGERGFDGTSIERIVRRAGTSQGALFARFPSKQALFLEATHRQNAASMRANEDFMSGIATAGSVGAGEAAFIRVAQRPQRAKDAAYLLEQVRLSWRDSELLDARSQELATFEDEYVRDHQQHHPAQDVSDLRAAVHVGSSIGLGILIPPMFVPWAHELPYDVVTVALMG